MPGATDTEFFARADMLDTKVSTEKKMDPAEVAQIGFQAMQDGEADVVAGLKNKMHVVMAKICAVCAGARVGAFKPGLCEAGHE